ALRQERGLGVSHVKPGRALRGRILDACRESNRALSETFLGGAAFGRPGNEILAEPEPPPLDEDCVGALMKRGVELLVPYMTAAGHKLKQQGMQLKQLEAAVAGERSRLTRSLDSARARLTELDRLEAIVVK